MKTISYRTCVITREKKEKKDLIKITKLKENGWVLDLEQKHFGRSIYINLSSETFDKFKKQRKRFKIEENEFETILKGLQGIVDGKNI